MLRVYLTKSVLLILVTYSSHFPTFSQHEEEGQEKGNVNKHYSDSCFLRLNESVDSALPTGEKRVGGENIVWLMSYILKV